MLCNDRRLLRDLRAIMVEILLLKEDPLTWWETQTSAIWAEIAAANTSEAPSEPHLRLAWSKPMIPLP